MKFTIAAEMSYQVRAASTILFNIHAFKSDRQQVIEESFVTDPEATVTELYSPETKNRFVRVSIPAACLFTIKYQALVDSHITVHEISNTDAEINGLEASILPYLYPSRYCQSDLLYRFADHNFGHFKGTFSKATAITKWIHANVKYLRRQTSYKTSAYDTVTELVGVCRDFAHLGIALCRALSIPARYYTGYAINLVPGDYHACFEVYVDGHWILFDPTFLVPLNGMVKVGHGRDAADTSIATMFGDMNFSTMKVSMQTAEEFTPADSGAGENGMISVS